MFLIQTPGGLNAVTDYTGFIGHAPTLIPDVVTMNHAHSTHWTAAPDPAIPHVLRGWGDGRTPAEHHLDLGEMLVRNVPTDIRSRFGGGVERRQLDLRVRGRRGSASAIWATCTTSPTREQYAAIGRLDVVMAPVDGGLTLDLPTMIRVLKRLRSSVVIPMHWFGARLARRLPRRHGGRVPDRARRASSARGLACGRCPDRPTVVGPRARALLDRLSPDR